MPPGVRSRRKGRVAEVDHLGLHQFLWDRICDDLIVFLIFGEVQIACFFESTRQDSIEGGIQIVLDCG